ncbi:histidine phosphatase family protein [Micromonospora sp. WMMD1155]|uniref:histidine phosphatase family protein n=1 Tax=Micromonospora sp. WMMD1155 TaxID=3016094 RepID=UPI00249A0AA2|nr:histidine phosphatase family protein [Micromonospora sp. WMMD1155]WFE54569.1 histidine phosphatase family protein [Micromonospora sp. WMMD1155]
MTATSLRLVAHAHTTALRRAHFGGSGEGLDEGGRRAALAQAQARRSFPGVDDVCVCSPAVAAVQTAEALELSPRLEAALADCDHGDWAGRSIEEIAVEQPHALHEWMSEPESAPHGGESVAAVRDRVGRWLDGQRGAERRITAIAHPLVIRVAVVHALDLPLPTYRQVDVEPLAVVRLTGRGARWHLRLSPPAG